MKDVWKKFQENDLTHSTAHHLMAIYDLLKTKGYARTIDIANYLKITRGSVAITLNKLKKRNLITEDENKFYRLSETGEEYINEILSKRNILEKFLTDVLNLPPQTAAIDACKIEHLISKEMAERLLSFMGYFLSDRKEVRRFESGFREFIYRCQSAENCEVCETECFYRGKPEKYITGSDE